MSRSRFVLVSTLCLVLFSVVFIAAPAHALGPRAVRLLVGGGWMGQSYNYKDIQLLDPDRKFWLTGGVSLEVGVFGDSPLDLEVGALYFQKGMQFDVKEYDEFDTYIGTATLDPKAKYLSFPVLLRYTFGRSTISPYIVAGPTFEVMVDHDDFEIFDEMDSANLGLQVGVGAELGNIGASLRYVRDLNTPYNQPAGATLESVVNDGVLALVTIKLWGR